MWTGVRPRVRHGAASGALQNPPPHLLRIGTTAPCNCVFLLIAMVIWLFFSSSDACLATLLELWILVHVAPILRIHPQKSNHIGIQHEPVTQSARFHSSCIFIPCSPIFLISPRFLIFVGFPPCIFFVSTFPPCCFLVSLLPSGSGPAIVSFQYTELTMCYHFVSYTRIFLRKPFTRI